jgi:hypothetical protein
MEKDGEERGEKNKGGNKIRKQKDVIFFTSSST